MPIIAKQVRLLGKAPLPQPKEPLNRSSDGFDPEPPFQMVPLGQSREMVVFTPQDKAELSFTTPGIASMSDFRVVQSLSPRPLFPLPPVGKIVLPEQSLVQFNLFGRAVGLTVLEGLDRPADGSPRVPDMRLRVSVKALTIRRVAIVYAFDRIHPDTGFREDFVGHFAEVDRIYFEQANFSIQNVDGKAGDGPGARTVKLGGSMGKVFNLSDDALIGRLIRAIDSKFPTLFRDVNTVVVRVPVPLKSVNPVTGEVSKIIALSVLWRRKADGRRFSLIIVRPLAGLAATKGPGARTPVSILQNTLAHEIGHSLGLKHHPVEEKDLPAFLFAGKAAVVFDSFRNLMFPTSLIASDRLNGLQVELIHQIRPHFREVDF